MLNKYYDGTIPEPGSEQDADAALANTAKALIDNLDNMLDELAFSKLLSNIWELISQANRYIAEQAPGALYKEGSQERLSRVLFTLLESLYTIALLIYPYMPATAQQMWEQLGIEEVLGKQRLNQNSAWGNITAGTKINQANVLFPKIEVLSL